MERILRLRHIVDRYGKSRSTVYLEIDRGLFPEGIDLGGRLVGWRESEIDALIRARIAGRSEDEIRGLVVALEADRKKVA